MSDIITIPFQNGQANIPPGYENKGLVTDESGQTYILAVSYKLSSETQKDLIAKYNRISQVQYQTSISQSQSLSSQAQPVTNLPNDSGLPTPTSSFNNINVKNTFVPTGETSFVRGVSYPMNQVQGVITKTPNPNIPSRIATAVANLNLPFDKSKTHSFISGFTGQASNALTLGMLEDTRISELEGQGSSARQFAQDVFLEPKDSFTVETPYNFMGITEASIPKPNPSLTAGRIAGMIAGSYGASKLIVEPVVSSLFQPTSARTIQVSDDAFTTSSTQVDTMAGSFTTRTHQQLLSQADNKIVFTSALDDVSKSGRSITIGYADTPRLTTYSYSEQGMSEGIFNTQQGEWLSLAKGSMTGKGYRYPSSIISTTFDTIKGSSGVSEGVNLFSSSGVTTATKTGVSLTSGVNAIQAGVSLISQSSEAVSLTASSLITGSLLSNTVERTKPVITESLTQPRTTPAVTIKKAGDKMKGVYSLITGQGESSGFNIFNSPITLFESAGKTGTKTSSPLPSVSLTSTAMFNTPPFIFADIGKGSEVTLGSGFEGKSTKMPKGYRPDFASSVFKIYGKKPKTTISGFEPRPMIKGERVTL